MPTLAYYSSPALTQAEKNLARWQTQHATMQRVEAETKATAGHIFPLSFAQASITTAELRTKRYAGFVKQAENEVAAERASAYLAHTATQHAAEEEKTPWLVRFVGRLLTAAIELFPSQVSAPAVAFA